MFYQFGFILVLAAGAANGQDWIQSLLSTTASRSDVLKDLIDPGESVIIGYKPIYGRLNYDLDEEDQLISGDWDFKCPKQFGYFRYQQSCDVYIECRKYQSTLKVCPDGMHFKENPRWSEYPCGYPPEAQCLIRENALPARPTTDCQHQFGNFPISNDLRYSNYNRCSSYISCASGIAYVMNCTVGLVFNPAISSCDWPENVPGCQDIFNFRCPVPHLGEEDMVINYRYPKDPECRYFYSCLNGHYRLLACDEGLFFDQRIGRCSEEDNFVCEVAND